MVHKGTAFEHRSRRILQDHLNMSLRCIGGRADGGIDLIGWWWVPTATGDTRASLRSEERPPWRRIRVLAQCKAEKKKPTPGYIRELEGVAHQFLVTASESLDPQRQKNLNPLPVAAVLVSQAPFTRGTLVRAYSSALPFLLLHLPPEGENGEEEALGAAFWNAALAGEKGLLGGEVELRWERTGVVGEGCIGIGRPGLWWRGRKMSQWSPGYDDDNDDDGGLG